ncbi:hypothetical protein VOLCADRAFT_89054 [Volvox carteri f. nagariensis]|uniref:Uncharacterized protein n=1 Tax=Volvox carteri f. nagariensis TaxID=3068 RepID=D8TQN9_VOLCA|nr:uncharacterized protein VOLCADRAFT_89054 [Volvox carteri f. nagariensis]EFJ50069.1 hypothetical protein VOLCADRAFT_89054 [Volvox carteri f. nagariensis]|eukprot:XP_002948689.1 hypothetical protein VOLCADRAFT_89054 [Volvox carteri f. nagariensis]
MEKQAQPTGDTPCSQVPVLGYKMNIEEKYLIGRELGKGGNGVVRVVVNRETGEEFACKSIKKVLKDASEKKKQGHIESIRREVAALSKLQGSLNVVKLEDVFEDEDHVYIIMEMCKGGELWHRIGDRHYSERTVASFMRAVLRTLAQCHAQNIIHRDIKPGNFMLLSGDERAPVKAIDFGLAAPFDQQQLPRTDLGLEGTPWYMAPGFGPADVHRGVGGHGLSPLLNDPPETLRGEWSPSSDMWAAGVMAFQLLSGRFPFDDKQNSFAPAITAIWRSVLNDPLDFSHPSWGGISAEARDFCKLLLNRDVAARPSAREALKHPWLKGDSSERSVGKKISRTVVARIQRFASGSLFRRSVLQYIAAELLSHPELLMASRMTSSSATAAAAVAAGAEAAAGGSGGGGGTVGEEEASVAKDTKVVAAAGSNDRVVAASELAALAGLLSQFRLDRTDSSLDERQLGEVLAKMGFRLAPSEVSRLMEGLDTDRSGSVGRSDLAACLVDWRHMQRNHTDLWLQLAARAFRHLDLDSSGVLEVDELIAAMRARLPPEEVAEALQEAMEEAAAQAAAGGCVYGGAAATAGVSTFGFGAASFGGGVMAGSSLADAQGLDFEAFVRLLKGLALLVRRDHCPREMPGSIPIRVKVLPMVEGIVPLVDGRW